MSGSSLNIGCLFSRPCWKNVSQFWRGHKSPRNIKQKGPVYLTYSFWELLTKTLPKSKFTAFNFVTFPGLFVWFLFVEGCLTCRKPIGMFSLMNFRQRGWNLGSFVGCLVDDFFTQDTTPTNQLKNLQVLGVPRKTTHSCSALQPK